MLLNDAPVVVTRSEQLRVRPLQLCLHFLELIVRAAGEVLLGVALDRTAKLWHLVMLLGLLDEETDDPFALLDPLNGRLVGSTHRLHIHVLELDSRSGTQLTQDLGDLY